MTRIKRGPKTLKRQKTMLLVKGYKGASSKLFRAAKQRLTKALTNAYIHRRTKKRALRSIWIKRINSVLASSSLNYSKTVCSLRLKNVKINRKILSQLAILDLSAFDQVIKSTNI